MLPCLSVCSSVCPFVYLFIYLSVFKITDRPVCFSVYEWEYKFPLPVAPSFCLLRLYIVGCRGCFRTPVPICDFNKVALQLYWNYTSHGCFPINLLHIFRTTFLSEHLWRAASVLILKLRQTSPFITLWIPRNLTRVYETDSASWRLRSLSNCIKK